jgi:hypothetical protein
VLEAFLFGPKVSELGPSLAHLAHLENALVFILRLLLRCTFSLHAFSYYAYFHSPPSPTTPVFITRLLLRRLFSFPSFSYDAYFHSPPAPSPIALIFISCILLIRLFSLCKYCRGIIVPECLSFRLNWVPPMVPPHPLPRQKYTVPLRFLFEKLRRYLSTAFQFQTDMMSVAEKYILVIL